MTSLAAWFLHYTGSNNTAGSWYGFWSGFGSDIGEVALLGAIVGMWRAHTCHVGGCWRWGRHKVDGTGHIVCRRHHPDDTPTHHRVLADHEAAKR